MKVADIIAGLDAWFPPGWAADWDRVGLVLGHPERAVRRVHLTVDVTPETVAEALASRAELIVAHHPLLLRGVSSVAPTTHKGRIVHQLIEAGVALYVAHTNADVANPGVSDALASRLGLTELRPLRPALGAATGEGRGYGRIGVLPSAMSLDELVSYAAAALPATAWGVRAAGPESGKLTTIAVCGGAGDEFLADAAAAGVDAYLTADLRHHPASEHLADGGPALLDAAHWATERPWLDTVAGRITAEYGVETVVSDLNTDPWRSRASSDDVPDKEDRHP
ncbi:MAG: Nif3-like dinuclear metal center hexameric protein [Micromonosporaceae bacterium]